MVRTLSLSRSTRQEGRRLARGFTLTETAIAMLVIALLLAGVLATDGLITQARVREICRESSALVTTLHLYRARYGALPGDDPHAGIRWPGVPSGNGNGAVGGRFDRAVVADAADPASGNDDDEPLIAWWHLRRAGFLVGAPEGSDAVAPPRLAGVGTYGVQTGAFGLSGPVACAADAAGAIAEGVDRSLDDGSPHTGSVRSGSSLSNVAAQYASDTRYVVCVSLERGMGPSVLASAAGAGASASATATGGTAAAEAGAPAPAAGDSAGSSDQGGASAGGSDSDAGATRGRSGNGWWDALLAWFGSGGRR
jgi:prepilin-type N-terminal cleavage/methylation domain-containing protein